MFNSSKFDELLNKYKNNKLAHAYIFNTNNFDNLKNDLNKLIKNILCENNYVDDCQNKCNICHLFDTSSLPNYIDIYPDGMQIKRDQIEYIKDKFSKIPLYGKYNIYVINNCDYLNDKSSNIFLKFLEEPESNILGFFVTDNIEKVLPTIKSRCEIVNVLYEDNDSSLEEYMECVTKFIEYIKSSEKNIYLIYDMVFGENDFSRKDCYDFLKLLTQLFEKNISQHNVEILEDFDIIKSVAVMNLLNETLSKIKSNVNIEVALIVLALELRNIYE